MDYVDKADRMASSGTWKWTKKLFPPVRPGHSQQ